MREGRERGRETEKGERGTFMAEGKVGGNTGGAGTAVWKGRIKCQLESIALDPLHCTSTLYMFLMRDEKEEKRRKQGQTNKQGKATQHTQGSHFS